MFNKICTNSEVDKKNLIILSGFRFFEEDCIRVKIKMKKFNLFFILIALSISSCTVVTQGEVGVKRTYGTLHKSILNPGLHSFNPFTTAIIKLPIRTVNLEISLDLPSKEGILVSTQMSILYHIVGDSVPGIISKIGGTNYEEVVILSVFKSVAPNVSSRFMAKDMHTTERSNIENEVYSRMKDMLEPRGFIVEAILLKSIRLPAGLSRSIEEKLEAEQEAQRMEFVLTKEKKEAERKRIEAAGIRDAQQTITQGLNPLVIEWKSIEAFKDIASSPNQKYIITDGKTPFLINPASKSNK